jgi:hypothetical protein
MKTKLFLFLSIFCVFAFCSCSKKDSVNGAPGSFSVAVTNVTDKTAALNWTIAKDPENGAVAYAVTLNGQAVVSGLNTTNFTLQNLTKNLSYTGVVSATDNAGNKTDASFSFATGDAPTPSDFTLTVDSTTNKAIGLSWSASTLPGNAQVLYDVYINNVLAIPNISALNTLVPGLQPDNNYQVKVIAKSADGKSIEKTVAAKTKINNTPSTLSITKGTNGFSYVLLNCTAATDADGDTLTYYIERNGNVLAMGIKNPAAAFEYAAKSLASNTDYTLAVIAIDPFGARSKSNTINVKTNIAPPTNFLISTKEGTDVAVEWIADSQQRFEVTGSQYVIDGVVRNLTATQVTVQDIANGKMTVKILIPLSQFPAEKISPLQIKLSWGVYETLTQSASHPFANLTYTASPALINLAILRRSILYNTKSIYLTFVNDVISNYNDWSIEQIKVANYVTPISVGYTKAGNLCARLEGDLNDVQFEFLKSFNIGFFIIKDADGYHRINFTYTISP